MGRPIGHRLSQESKDRIGAGVHRAAEERRQYWSGRIALAYGDPDRQWAITRELHAEMGQRVADRMSWDLTDAEASQLGREMAAAFHELAEERIVSNEESPYKGIPSITEHAAAEKRNRNRLQGEPYIGPVPHAAARTGPLPPDAPSTHGKMTGRHTHEHYAYSAADADDEGVHRHSHEHFEDRDHHARSDSHEHD